MPIVKILGAKFRSAELHKDENAIEAYFEHETEGTIQIRVECFEIGTYKNDNAKKLLQLKKGHAVDLIEGEQGLAINLNPKTQKYYSPDSLFMPDGVRTSNNYYQNI